MRIRTSDERDATVEESVWDVADGAAGQLLRHWMLPVHREVKSSSFRGQPPHFLPSCHGD